MVNPTIVNQNTNDNTNPKSAINLKYDLLKRKISGMYFVNECLLSYYRKI